MDEIKLNDPNNLNPTDSFKQMSDEDKKKLTNDWENKPSVKEKEIGAYDKKTEVPINKVKLGLIKILAIISTLALLIIAGTIGYSFYYNYKMDNQMSLFPQAICAPNITIPQCPELPKIPSCPAAPDCTCKLTCDNVTVSPVTPIVNVYTNHT